VDKMKRTCIAPKMSNSVARKRQLRPPVMLKVKDTLRATVHLSFDGRVFKAYHGPDAAKRFANEVRVLRHLEAHGCNFVPRLLEADEANLRIVTTNCGTRVEHIDAQRAAQLFAELKKYGVRHDDADPRNITYRFGDGRFCLIDFEFATLLPDHPETLPALPRQVQPRQSPAMVWLHGYRPGPQKQRRRLSGPAL